MASVRILVADDYAPRRHQARALLRQRPEWQITEACNGLEAVQKSAELRPEVVLLDIGMPFLNGIEAAKRIRASTPYSIVIFVTQDNDKDVKVAALATGAEAYLSKAEAASELLPIIETALASVKP